MLLYLLITLVRAEMPPPDYDRVLARAAWVEVNRIIEESCTFDPMQRAFACTSDLDHAIQRAEAFQRQIFQDAGLAYLIGLAHKYAGRDDAAARAYREALKLEPDRAEAWYDLGEILLARQELEEAERAFTHVSELIDHGDKAWLGPWRLAEVAAHRGDPDTFERHIREALRRGFSFRTIMGLPNWRAFYANPALRDSIDKLVTVYGEPSVLDSLSP